MIPICMALLLLSGTIEAADHHERAEFTRRFERLLEQGRAEDEALRKLTEEHLKSQPNRPGQS